MDFGINVESIQQIEKKDNRKKDFKENNQDFNVKLKEYTFFVKNEIEVSNRLNSIELLNLSNNIIIAHRFLTIKNYDFIKICETNKEIIEKMNIPLKMENNNKIVLLKYKNHGKMYPFINSFFKNYINNTSIFTEKPRAAYIFWDFIHVYEKLCDDLIYLNSKNVLFLDFSHKNLLYNDEHNIFFNNFEKCLVREQFNVSKNDLSEDGYLQKLAKYIEIEKYVDKFIEIIDTIDHYGNKHFDLYFSKQLIKDKNFYTTFQNLDSIMDTYLDNLYFLKNFSDKFKNDNKNKWKSSIRSKIEENIRFFNIDTQKLSWKLYLLMILENYNDTVWETFCLNSLFLNITYNMMKIFAVKDKTCVIHKFLKFLFMNMDINCVSFNNTNNINSDNGIPIILSRENYDHFYNSITEENFNGLHNVNIEQHDEIYDLLSKTNIIDEF